MFSLVACAGSSSIDFSADKRPQGLSVGGQKLLSDVLRKEGASDRCGSRLGKCRDELREFYDSLGGALGWIIGTKPTRQALELHSLLEMAGSHGLDPEDYDTARWDERIEHLQTTGSSSESNLIAFDVALTLSVMKYISDVHIGRVNPRHFHPGLDVDHKNIDLSEFIGQRLIRSPNVSAAIQSIELPSPVYRRTVEALRRYRELANQDDGELLPIPARPIRIGERYQGLPGLVRRLSVVGDLQPTANAAGGKVMTAEIVEAVKRFQRRHGLEPSGRLDAITVEELNTPLSRRVAQLELTLERWRWLPHEFEHDPIIVNVPEFVLRAGSGQHESDLSMKVVVGSAYEHETPIFASQLASIILRPSWDVPSSIQKDELVQHIARDRNYLVKNSYQVVDKNGKVVSDGSIDRRIGDQLRSGDLGLRQKPGPHNALGLIKFDFPNQYSVYLHGTPVARAFDRQRRDLSHGCIRVEDPVALAAWVLKDHPEWNAEKINAASYGDATILIKTPPVPILIVYMTGDVSPDGEVHFYRDIYKQDAALHTALTQGRSATSTRSPVSSDASSQSP